MSTTHSQASSSSSSAGPYSDKTNSNDTNNKMTKSKDKDVRPQTQTQTISFTAPGASVGSVGAESIRFGAQPALPSVRPFNVAGAPATATITTTTITPSYAHIAGGAADQKKIEKDNDDFSRRHQRDLAFDKDNKGDFKDKFDDTYKPSYSKLPDLSTSQKEWEGKSAHIMKWKKMDEALRLAARTGAVHQRGVPVSEAVNKVEHKFDTNLTSDTGCDKQQCDTFINNDHRLAADHALTEFDVLAIRRHDLVAEQAASAGGMLQKSGWFKKQVGVETATDLVNKTKSTQPSVLKKIGTQIRGVTASIGDSFVNAKDAVITAKDDFVGGISEKPIGRISNEQKLKDINESSSELDTSLTATKSTSSSLTSTTEGGPSRMQRMGAAATSVKDTVYDAGVRAGPYLQKAATVAGQVLSVAGAIAQPLVHHLAQGVAEVSAPPKQSDSLKEEIVMNVKDVQMKDGQRLEGEGEVSKDKDTTELSGSFRTKPWEPAAAPLTAGQFMQHEVKSRPSSPVHSMPSHTTTSLGDVPAPLAASNTWLPDKTFDQPRSNISGGGMYHQMPMDQNKSKDTTTTTNSNSNMNSDYDLQVKQKNNTNNTNFTQNQQRLHQQQQQQAL